MFSVAACLGESLGYANALSYVIYNVAKRIAHLYSVAKGIAPLYDVVKSIAPLYNVAKSIAPLLRLLAAPSPLSATVRQPASLAIALGSACLHVLVSEPHSTAHLCVIVCAIVWHHEYLSHSPVS